MIDVVYTFKYDRRSWNHQLKYSLRSIEKHLSGVRNVYVIGFRCNMPGVIQIEHNDILSATRNIMDKLQFMANHRDLSEDFLYMGDDHFLLKDVEAEKYPVYSNGTLRELFATQNNSYKMMVKSTFEELEARGVQAKNYNIHCPVVYNKTMMRAIAGLYPLSKPLGYLSKSLYLNTFPPHSSIELKDCKISKNISVEDMKKKIHGRDCFSTGKESDCPNIGLLLEELYPNKSKYESCTQGI